MTLPDPDALNRTAKILIDDGAPSFEAAESTIAGWTIQLALGTEASLLPVQVAALTAAVTAKRAAGIVTAALADDAEIPCLVPGFTQSPLRAALEALGAAVVAQPRVLEPLKVTRLGPGSAPSRLDQPSETVIGPSSR
ncbi:hypothetical protein [Kribbella swartbergensis]